MAETNELRAALEGVLEWDKQRDFILPYRVRDPIHAALASQHSTAAEPVAIVVGNCAHTWELMGVGPTTTQHSWHCRLCGANATTWPEKPGQQAAAPNASTPITNYSVSAAPPSGFSSATCPQWCGNRAACIDAKGGAA